jgi:hypothetical protein
MEVILLYTYSSCCSKFQFHNPPNSRNRKSLYITCIRQPLQVFINPLNWIIWALHFLVVYNGNTIANSVDVLCASLRGLCLDGESYEFCVLSVIEWDWHLKCIAFGNIHKTVNCEKILICTFPFNKYNTRKLVKKTHSAAGISNLSDQQKHGTRSMTNGKCA